MRAKEFIITVGVDAHGETDVQVRPMHQHSQDTGYPEPEQASCGCDGEQGYEDEPEADDAQLAMVSPQQQEIELQKAALGKKSIVAAQLVDNAEDDEIA